MNGPLPLENLCTSWAPLQVCAVVALSYHILWLTLEPGSPAQQSGKVEIIFF